VATMYLPARTEEAFRFLKIRNTILMEVNLPKKQADNSFMVARTLRCLLTLSSLLTPNLNKLININSLSNTINLQLQHTSSRYLPILSNNISSLNISNLNMRLLENQLLNIRLQDSQLPKTQCLNTSKIMDFKIPFRELLHLSFNNRFIKIHKIKLLEEHLEMQ
jgi:hypothetical protein